MRSQDFIEGKKSNYYVLRNPLLRPNNNNSFTINSKPENLNYKKRADLLLKKKLKDFKQNMDMSELSYMGRAKVQKSETKSKRSTKSVELKSKKDDNKRFNEEYAPKLPVIYLLKS